MRSTTSALELAAMIVGVAWVSFLVVLILCVALLG